MRARQLKPSFFDNEVLGSLPALARLLFQGLWCAADKYGRLEDRPARLKVLILPYDECDVDELLDLLFAYGFIERYESDGFECIQIVNFEKHQNPHPKEKSAELPECSEEALKSREIKRPEIKRTACPKKRKRKEEEGKGRGKEGGAGETISNLPTNLDTPACATALRSWLDFKRERREGYTRTGLSGLLKKLESWGPEATIQAIETSIASNYAGLFPPKTAPPTNGTRKMTSAEKLLLELGHDGN